MPDRERLTTPVPGPRSRAYAERLRASESRGVTYLADDFPVFWYSGSGATVTDVDDNRYLDLTAAFGVAAVGHANPAVAQAIAEQARRLPHGMGDVHPGDVRTDFVERLAALVPMDQARVFLCSTGAEAVEFALKTAMLATGKPDAIAFENAYHGLSYGALEVCGNPVFRDPWRAQLRNATTFIPFPAEHKRDRLETTFERIENALRANPAIGALIVEPIQGRAGAVVPPDGFLIGLRTLCDQYGALLILDEIYTGFGRTGELFAAQRERIQPDLLCMGKALGGGFPISAVAAPSDIMNAWEPSNGEALHTSTYLGNPMGCAAALAVLHEIERLHIVERACRIGEIVADRAKRLSKLSGIRNVRGRGALWGIETTNGDAAHRIVVKALARGLILLQSGRDGATIQLSPPLIIEHDQLEHALDILSSVIHETISA
jgi:4-aminobutyrate aminotransferase/(S)-3-amino-2-methylpropionate transaminase